MTRKEKIIFFECASGISGDMILSAFLDLGYPLAKLKKSICLLKGIECNITINKKIKNGITAGKINIKNKSKQEFRHYNKIKNIITKSSLSKYIKDSSLNILHKIAAVESKIHGINIEKIHFHEIGAIDTIVDIVGAMSALEYFGYPHVFFPVLPLGNGSGKISHGIIPFPAPATTEILKGYKVKQLNTGTELVTPTGAAIITEMGEQTETIPEMKLEKIGYSTGDKDIKKLPGVLRVFYGTSLNKNIDEITVLECSIDDMTPEELGFLMQKLLKNNVLDVFYVPIYMKKNRPAVMLTVLCNKSKTDKISELIFRNSTTNGIRYKYTMRKKLETRIFKIKILNNTYVNVKAAYYNNEMLHISPEYDDCIKIAEKTGKCLSEIYEQIKTKFKK